MNAGTSFNILVDIEIEGNRLTAMVDCGAQENYISPTVINRHQLPWVRKEETYKIVNVEGTQFEYNNGIVDTETDHLTTRIHGKNFNITYDVVRIDNHDAILGLPWLRSVNPLIDWYTGRIEWRDTLMYQPQDQEKPKFRQTLEGRKDPSMTVGTTIKTPHDSSRQVDAADTTNTAPQPGTIHQYKQKMSRQELRRTTRTLARIQKMLPDKSDPPEEKIRTEPECPDIDFMDWARMTREEQIQYKKDEELNDKYWEQQEERLSKVPEQYREQYKRLFQEELKTGVPEHSQWDHEISIIEGGEPAFHKLYNLTEPQLQTLREYIDDMLAKGHIRLSNSSAGYPVMFVPKKNGKLRLVVDYRQLNKITRKDRTPLPLITELRDRLRGKQWFTALDLKGAYGLVRIKEGDEWKTATWNASSAS